MTSLTDDYQFLYDTQPSGGISFKDEYYNRMGTGYQACLHIYKFPFNYSEFWLNAITSLPNTVVTVDNLTDKDVDYIKKVQDSVKEMHSVVTNAKTQTEADKANQEFNELRELNLSLINAGEKIKKVHIRIYVKAPTKEELEKRVDEIQKQLDGNGFKSAVYLDENKVEWQSLFLGYEDQQKLAVKREGNEIQSEVMGLGFAHDQTSLKDPSGAYYGYTRTYGTVYWDLFHRTDKRLYYNAFLCGDMGAGKSHLLKKIMRDNASKGYFIRGFDKSGEFFSVVEDQGGKTINLDGSGGRINLMQVFPTVTIQDENDAQIDEAGSFRQHVSKLNMTYRILNTDANSNDLMQFDELVYDFYRYKGLWGGPIVTITQLALRDYPKLSEFQSYCEERYRDETDERYRGRIGDIAKAIKNLITNYGDLFEGETTIPNLMHEQMVFYDIGNLSQMDEKIFDIQMYNALTQIWANMMAIGRKEKEAFENKSKSWWDVTRFLIVVDECHNILNIKKAFAASFFVTLMSEARKFFSGIVLATQRLDRMFPQASNVQDKKMVEAANKLSEIFGLTQYKFLMKMDQTTMKKIRELFEDQFTENEYRLLPTFSKGDCILSIAGDQNLVMHVEATQEEIDLFKGGA